MKPSLRPGVSRVNRIQINRERTIGFMGEEARTYATPSMVLDIEHTCRELIIEHADPGEDSVGMEVALKVFFEASVKDDLEDVGRGSHTRFVVEKAKTLERLKAKAAKLAARPG